MTLAEKKLIREASEDAMEMSVYLPPDDLPDWLLSTIRGINRDLRATGRMKYPPALHSVLTAIFWLWQRRLVNIDYHDSHIVVERVTPNRKQEAAA